MPGYGDNKNAWAQGKGRNYQEEFLHVSRKNFKHVCSGWYLWYEKSYGSYRLRWVYAYSSMFRFSMLVVSCRPTSLCLVGGQVHLVGWQIFARSRCKIEKVPRDIRRALSGKVTTSSEKGLVSRSKTYASPKRTGPSVRMSKRPLSACHTRRKFSMETNQNSVKDRVRYKVWLVGGCHCIWPGQRMSFNICERETSYW